MLLNVGVSDAIVNPTALDLHGLGNFGSGATIQEAKLNPILSHNRVLSPGARFQKKTGSDFTLLIDGGSGKNLELVVDGYHCVIPPQEIDLSAYKNKHLYVIPYITKDSSGRATNLVIGVSDFASINDPVSGCCLGYVETDSSGIKHAVTHLVSEIGIFVVTYTDNIYRVAGSAQISARVWGSELRDIVGFGGTWNPGSFLLAFNLDDPPKGSSKVFEGTPPKVSEWNTNFIPLFIFAFRF